MHLSEYIHITFYIHISFLYHLYTTCIHNKPLFIIIYIFSYHTHIQFLNTNTFIHFIQHTLYMHPSCIYIHVHTFLSHHATPSILIIILHVYTTILIHVVLHIHALRNNSFHPIYHIVQASIT